MALEGTFVNTLVRQDYSESPTLDEAYKRIPPIKEYIYQSPDFPLISEKGVQLILDHLGAKNCLKIEAIALSSLGEFEECLQKILLQKEVKCGFVVRHSDNPFQIGSYHMTPVYLEKNGESIKALVTDSTGGESSLYPNLIALKIAEVLNIVPYVYNEQRQDDCFRCSVFSIRDLVQIGRNPNIFQEIEQNGHLSSMSDEVAHYFQTLPPSMMIVTQKRETLEHYQGDRKAVIHRKKHPESKETFIQIIEKHSDASGNLYTAKKFQKYQRIILEKLSKS